MKRIPLNPLSLLRRVQVVMLLCLLLIGGLTSCSDSNSESEPPKDLYLVACTSSKNLSAEAIKAIVNNPQIGALIDQQPSKMLTTASINYHTVDPQGKAVVASGLVVFPADMKPIGMIVAQRGTIFMNSEAPSVAGFQIDALFSLAGYAVVMPDLIGFGATSDLPHPYLHAANTAQVSVDMLFAAREYLVQQNKSYGDPLYAMGYSQGGHAALAFQRLAESKYADEMRILCVYAGAGLYDFGATFDAMVRSDYTSYPCSIPYIVQGINAGDNLGLNFNNLYREPLLSNYKKWYGKSYSSLEINELIGSTKISDFMHADMFTSTMNQDFKKLRAALVDNSLVNWTPVAPIVLFHGQDDTVVPLINAENARTAFMSKGCEVGLVYHAW